MPRCDRIRSSRSPCAIPAFDETHWRRIVDVVADRLLTPYGLRALDPGHKDFKTSSAIFALAMRRITRGRYGPG